MRVVFVVRGRETRSCATENTYISAPLETLVQMLSVVLILCHLVRSIRTICTIRSIISAGCGCSSPTRHPVRHFLHLDRDFFENLLLAVRSVAIHLVHANANLFLSRKIDQCRMMLRLSLDFTEFFATAGDTLCFVSAVL